MTDPELLADLQRRILVAEQQVTARRDELDQALSRVCLLQAGALLVQARMATDSERLRAVET